MFQALNKAGPEDRAGVERPLSPNRSPPRPSGDDGAESNLLAIKACTTSLRLAGALLAVGISLPAARAGAGATGVPEPTFAVPFDDTVAPRVASGERDHPAIRVKPVSFVPGKKGKAVLLGNAPSLSYRAHGNVRDHATISFWMKPIAWQRIQGVWRYLLTIRAAGRRSMILAQPASDSASLKFAWSPRYGTGMEWTKSKMEMDAWNHVAVAWDGVRSRVYFNGRLVLSKNHPPGLRPEIPPITTLHLGGIPTEGMRGMSSKPWGKADTAIDELVVYPGALTAVQVAALAGVKKETRPLRSMADTPPRWDIPKLRKTPRFDGRLEDGEWDGAATVRTLIDGHDPARSFDYPEQKVRFGYDDENLYVAFRAHFPDGAGIVKAAQRKSLDDKDVEVWSSESFEFYVRTLGDKHVYRFAGSPGGGFTESHAKNYAWNGRWIYRTSMGMTITSRRYWDAEIAVPFETLGIGKADGARFGMNFARTWRCLDAVGVTSLIGGTHYGSGEHFARVHLSPSAPAYGIRSEGSPSMGKMARTFTFRNRSDKPFAGTLTLVLEAALKENDKAAQKLPVRVGPGETIEVAPKLVVQDPMFQRVRTVLAADGAEEPQLSYSVPFLLRTDFLDVVPLCLQDKLVIKPAAILMAASLRAEAKGDVKIMTRVFGPTGKAIFEQAVTGDQDIWLDLPRGGPWGNYRVSLFATDAEGGIYGRNDREFHRPPPPVWMKQRDDSMDRVLPPFTPIETEQTKDAVHIRPWGREYRYEGSLFPTEIGTGGVKNILAGPMDLVVDNQVLSAAQLTVGKTSQVRDELVAKGQNESLRAGNSFWIEYDGVIYHTLALEALKPVKHVTLRIPIRKEHARFAHICESGMGAGGGSSRPVEKSFSMGFWPVVWLGDFERGLCWFAEGKGDLHTRAGQPISVTVGEKETTLAVRLTDALAAGQKAAVRFGLLATPVRPLHPRYPLNVHAGVSSLFEQPPKRRLYSWVAWGEELGFWDFKFYRKRNKKWFHPSERLADFVRRGLPGIVIPYMTPYTLPSEYPEANHYVREWEIRPTRHWKRPKGRALPGGGARDFVNYFMSPWAESYRKYYAYRVADMIRRTGVRGLYFDFGTALRDANAYHGARGGVCLLGMRDFYRRIANEFVKAGFDDHVIVVHNSMAVQIPAFTHVTHFFNGEHHRHKSGSTLHHGKDYLDTLPLYYFGIEHSGLPWGIHGNMLPEFPEAEHLLAQDGVKEETVSEYLWDRTPSVMMPILLHNCLPGGYRLSHYYYKAVFNVLDDFDIPSAKFHPYWRNQEEIEVGNPDFRVSFYTRPEAPRALLVVGNLNKESGETTIKLDMRRLYDWRQARGGMARVKKKGAHMQVVERLGARDARILEIGPQHFTLWVKGHSMALVEVSGHQRLR